MKQRKKRNPQDATLRNINALKKRVARLERALKWLENAGWINEVKKLVWKMEER